MNTHEKRDFIAKKCKQFRELLPDGVTLTDIRQTWTVEQVPVRAHIPIS